MTQGREVELAEGEVSLGRSQSANVTVKDVSVSRNHAMIQARDGRLVVKDLNSSNGTFLNGMRIFAEAELHDGDHLTLGESELRVRIEAPESVAATMRIDPRALLAGEELRLQAQEEAAAALAALGAPGPAAGSPAAAIPFRSQAAVVPPRPAQGAMSPLVFEPTPAPPVPPSQPAPVPQLPVQPARGPVAPRVTPPPVDAPVALVPQAPAPAPTPSLTPTPTPAAALAPAPPPMPPVREPELLASLPALPPVEVAPPPPRATASEADAFALPDIDLPPLPPIDATKPGASLRSTGPRSPVVSPAAPAMQLQPVGFWIRGVAVILDGVWIGVLCLVAWFLTGSMLDDEQRALLLGVLSPALGLGAALVGWSIWGATPGKYVLGLHVCPEGSNSPGIGFGKGILRVIGYVVSSITGVGFVMVAFTKGKRGLHDMIAGTYVGRRKK